MERSLGVIRPSPWINIHKSGSVEKKLEEETVDLEVESENGRIFVEKKDLGGRKGSAEKVRRLVSPSPWKEGALSISFRSEWWMERDADIALLKRGKFRSVNRNSTVDPRYGFKFSFIFSNLSK